jgi:FKBP-type peptidyl-prolyl cis-trans isomerase FkpA
MKTFKQTGILFLIIALTFGFYSCLDVGETSSRTEEVEQAELDQYLKSLITGGYDIDTTELGIYYIKQISGQGVYPKKGDTLTVGYAGYFINGLLFDSSTINSSEGAITFNYIDDPMIAGFEDGLKLMNKGSQIQMIIPSKLAYGAYGTLSIPPYTTLVFVTEMKDLRPKVIGN